MARPGDDQGRRRVAVDEPALAGQVVDGGAGNAGARLRLSVHVPGLIRSPLGWSPVPYAASYMFSLASDPALANIVQNSGQPVETWATNYVPSFTLLPSGTYYWNVVPVDSEGNRGAASPVSSFSYSWPSVTSPP